MHAERAAPNGAKAFLSYFLCLTKSMGKDLILFVRSCCLGRLIRGLENLETPCEGTDWYFLRRAKSTAKTRRGLRPSGLPGTIQSSAGNSFEEAFRRHVSKPVFRKKSGEKALNRCDVPVLQREDLERTTKEWTCFLRTVGYGWVEICGVWSEKGLLWIAKRKGLCKRKAFGL